MNNTSDGRRLNLSVSNFGPLSEARIELRPLTVFVGPSNSGKSYLASLIYAMHKSLNGFLGQPSYSPFLPSQFWAGGMRETQSQSYELSEEDVTFIAHWFGECEGRTLLSEEARTGFIELPDPISKLVKPVVEDDSMISAILEAEIARCFGVDETSELFRYGSGSEAQLSLQGSLPFEKQEKIPFSFDISLAEQGAIVKPSFPEETFLQADIENFGESLRLNWLREEFWPDDVPPKVFGSIQLLFSLARTVFSGVIDPFSRPAYYLPAGRAGVMHAHQVVVRSLIAGASRAALRPDTDIPILSGVLGDFLDQLVSLASRSPEADERYAVLAGNLEHSMLQGSVNVDKSKNIDYPSFSYRPEGWDQNLPLMNASSMVSELAPVVLYLRHLVKQGDLLIVEEPEAHLHPKMQAAFTRQLVVAVQSGIRILITTHSEWILEELANLLRLSELPVDRRNGIENPEIAISPEQLGTWFFDTDEKKGGSVVREITLEEESGSFPAGYGLVGDSLYNRWAEIVTLIEEE